MHLKTGGLVLPDPDDRHVLAASIVGRCDVIVTQNLQDFPEAVIKPYGIETHASTDRRRNACSTFHDSAVPCFLTSTCLPRLSVLPKLHG